MNIPGLIEIEKENLWELSEDMVFYIGTNKGKIVVPKGFQTNLASVPQFLRGVYKPWGTYTKACVLHDYLYSKESCYNINKEDSDRIFNWQMAEDGTSDRIRVLFYGVVMGVGQFQFEYKKNNGLKPTVRCHFEDFKNRSHDYEERRAAYRKYRKEFEQTYGELPIKENKESD